MTDSRITQEVHWRYTLACPGSTQFGEDKDLAKWRAAHPNDPRDHWPRGWESLTFGDKCPDCGEVAQQRGSYQVNPL